MLGLKIHRNSRARNFQAPLRRSWPSNAMKSLCKLSRRSFSATEHFMTRSRNWSRNHFWQRHYMKCEQLESETFLGRMGFSEKRRANWSRNLSQEVGLPQDAAAAAAALKSTMMAIILMSRVVYDDGDEWCTMMAMIWMTRVVYDDGDDANVKGCQQCATWNNKMANKSQIRRWWRWYECQRWWRCYECQGWSAVYHKQSSRNLHYDWIC